MRTRNMIFAALLVFAGLYCLGQVGRPPVKHAIESRKPNYTITVTPPSGPLSMKSPLLIEMYYTNTTSSDIYMTADICSTCAGQEILLTKDGKEVDATPLQRLRTGRGSSSDRELFPARSGNSRTDRYHPGVFWKLNLDLRKLYNITEPGQYVLSASRTEETKDGKVVVKSNTVTLDLVP